MRLAVAGWTLPSPRLPEPMVIVVVDTTDRIRRKKPEKAFPSLAFGKSALKGYLGNLPTIWSFSDSTSLASSCRLDAFKR